MTIKILGTGCANCKRLEQQTRDAVAELGHKDISVEKVDALQDIMRYGILSTPGFVIDEKVVFSGRVPSKQEIISIISQHKGS
jgi:small redox-active disulfide protein 2